MNNHDIALAPLKKRCEAVYRRHCCQRFPFSRAVVFLRTAELPTVERYWIIMGVMFLVLDFKNGKLVIIVSNVSNAAWCSSRQIFCILFLVIFGNGVTMPENMQ